MISLEGTVFQPVQPDALSPIQRRAIDRLQQEVLTEQFPWQERNYGTYLLKADRVRTDPGHPEEGGLLDQTRLYSRPAGVLARDEETGTPLLYMGSLQETAPTKGWHPAPEVFYIGEVLIGSALRASISDAMPHARLMEAALDMLLRRQQAKQQVAATTWDREMLWQLELAALGLQPQPEQARKLQPLGAEAGAWSRQRWEGATVEQLRRRVGERLGDLVLAQHPLFVLERRRAKPRS